MHIEAPVEFFLCMHVIISLRKCLKKLQQDSFLAQWTSFLIMTWQISARYILSWPYNFIKIFENSLKKFQLSMPELGFIPPQPGDRVQVVGMYRCLPSKRAGFTPGTFRQYNASTKELSFNTFTIISLVILLTVCHLIIMLVWRIWYWINQLSPDR